MDARKPRTPTPRQALVAHLEEHHKLIKVGRKSLNALIKEHVEWHWRYGSHSHLHAGVNRGPGQRPPGWRTGLDVVPLVNGHQVVAP